MRHPTYSYHESMPEGHNCIIVLRITTKLSMCQPWVRAVGAPIAEQIIDIDVFRMTDNGHRNGGTCAFLFSNVDVRQQPVLFLIMRKHSLFCRCQG
jgi:hypothetical protein